MNIDQLARDERPPELVHRRQAWKNDYPWLRRAIEEIGPGARAASDRWRVRIEDELKTTLDFKTKRDGAATVWCGMSSHDFDHDPTPRELFEGLADAYRRERRRRQPSASHGPPLEEARRRAPGPPKPRVTLIRVLPPPVSDSLTRTLEALLVPRVADLVLIFLAVTALTLVLATVAIAAAG